MVQKLSTRSRKNVDIHDIKVNACIFAFDLLYLNGQSLLEEPLTDRREVQLHKPIFTINTNYFHFLSAVFICGADHLPPPAPPFFFGKECPSVTYKGLSCRSYMQHLRRNLDILSMQLN